MEILTQKISIFNGQNKIKMNNKGLTLLEVLITLAILGIITVLFISIFTTTNLNINFSGKKVNAIVESKSILDEIRSKIANSHIENSQEFNDIIREVLNLHYKGNNKIFDLDDNDLYKYSNKKIHCGIDEETIVGKSIENLENDIESSMCKVKIILFYDKGKKNIELSTYIPLEEDKNEE